jgi:hypothetical protein
MSSILPRVNMVGGSCGESIQWLADNDYIRINRRHAVVDSPPTGAELGFAEQSSPTKGSPP